MADDIFAPGFKTDPYWWDAAPRPDPGEVALPEEVDVAIAGSGYSGMSAAITLQRGGREAVILEAEMPGFGASTRNAGFVGRTLWHKFGAIKRKYGEKQALAMANTAVEAHKFAVEFIEREQISCGFVYCGRFIAAATPSHYEDLAKDLKVMLDHGLEMKAEMIPRAEQRGQIGTDRYYGGMLLHGTGALHPALYHHGFLDRVTRSGARVIGNTRVSSIRRDTDGRFTVETSRGSLRAKDVIVATNGYSEPGEKWFARRMVPIKGYAVATEPVSSEIMDAVLPTRRTVIDSKNNIYAIRPSPDGTRLIFFGRTGMEEGGEVGKAHRLHAAMKAVFPDLADVRLSHSWLGQMGFTFDKIPHIGVHDGVHYTMGYNGAGMPMGTYLGRQLGRFLLGDAEAATGFDGRGFPTRPFYRGEPWFLPMAVGYYNMRDRWDTFRK